MLMNSCVSVGGVPVLPQVLQVDIPELDLHRRSHVQLHADEPLHRSIRLIVVDEQRRDMSVQYVNQRVAAGDDLELIPVIDLDDGLQRFAVLHLANLAAQWWRRSGCGR